MHLSLFDIEFSICFILFLLILSIHNVYTLDQACLSGFPIFPKRLMGSISNFWPLWRPSYAGQLTNFIEHSNLHSVFLINLFPHGYSLYIACITCFSCTCIVSAQSKCTLFKLIDPSTHRGQSHIQRWRLARILFPYHNKSLCHTLSPFLCDTSDPGI